MKRLLVEGWRGVNHSFAMVNQHQLLALARLEKFALFHHDLPVTSPSWTTKDHAAGFDANSTAFLSGLADLAVQDADFVFRIGAPFRAPAATSAMTISFAVTEFGLQSGFFANAALPLSHYTQGADLVVTPSRWARDRLLDYGFAEGRVRVLPHGVDAEVFKPLHDDVRQQNRANLGIAADTVVFLNVGAPTWNKGVDILVEAFARLHQQHPDTRLILKDGSHLYGLSVSNTLSTLAARHPELMTPSLLASISVVSTNMTQAELCQLYNVCDCYVSPYRAEGFNLPVLEALACGKPVIVSSGGATDDFCHGAAVSRIPTSFHRGPLGDMASACWVEPHAPALRELMQTACARRTDPSSVSEAAVAQARLYSWDAAALALVDLYEGADAATPSWARVASASAARTMHIYCDGGFGNRFNGLVSGLILAKASGLRPIVVWPRNNWCGASFSDLFENEFEVIERELASYVPEKDEFHFFMTEDHLGMGVEYRSPLNAASVDDATAYLNAAQSNVHYHTPLIPTYLDKNLVLEQVRAITIRSEIRKIADDFLAENRLNEFFGIQIRKTDFGANGADEKNLYELVKNSGERRFFVCSDDKDVEAQFADMDNACVYQKRAYVEKLTDGGWNEMTADASGRNYYCNVNRSAVSVIDAVVDLLLLSYSDVITTSGSTFLQTALLLKSSRL